MARAAAGKRAAGAATRAATKRAGDTPGAGPTPGRTDPWALPDAHPAAGVKYGLGRPPRVVTKTRFHLNGRAAGTGGRGSPRRGQPLREHLVYLARPEAQVRPGEAVTGEARRADAPPPEGVFFDAQQDALDIAELPQRWGSDRHHWRVIVSPQEGGGLDLRAYTRDLATRLEQHFGTRLEWAAVAHFNTPHPHVHLLVRGVRDDGRDLRMTRDDVAEHLGRLAAGSLAARLGLKGEAEADAVLRALARRKRPTPLDGLLVAVARQQAGGGGAAGGPFTLPASWVPEACGRHHLRLRLETLERLGLASREVRSRTSWGGATWWTLRPGWREKLSQLAASPPETSRTKPAKALPRPRPATDKKQAADHPVEREGPEL